MDFTIENEILRVTVTDRGGQIKSVIRKSDGVEHMWCGDPSVWGSHSPILFPYAGRVKDGCIHIRGKRVENAPIHGVARTMIHQPVEQGKQRLVLSAVADDSTMQIFPYGFRLMSTFQLEGEKLLHTLMVENTDSEEFTFGIGYHPGFALPFDRTHSPEDYELRFSHLESPICLDTPTGLLNGKFYQLGSNLMSVPITEGMFNRGSHCMIGLKSETLGLYEKVSGRAVVCKIRDFPYCLIWGTPGTTPFVCIEPWCSLPSFEDGSYDWEKKPGTARLAPGQSWNCTMETAFVR